MKMTSNIHTHCTWCDGLNTPDEMAERAWELGFTDLGFSSHAPAPFDPTCPGVPDEAAYRDDIHRLKEACRGKINILCGAETDTYAPVDKEKYDYIICSSHYLPAAGGEYCAVDGDEDVLLQTIREQYGGSGLAMARAYYSLLVQGVKEQRPTVVGHFDLVKKYAKKYDLFNRDSREYREAALGALDEVLSVLSEYGGMLEVNTGIIAKGIDTQPYPDDFLLQYAAGRDARVIITNDSHHISTLGTHFDEALEHIRRAGFKKMYVLQDGEFVATAI